MISRVMMSVAASLCSLGCLAAYTSNVFASLQVDSSAEETIVALPWLGTGAGDAAIKVTDVVKTANLNVGDMLFAYVGNAYKAWILDSDKVWQPTSISAGNGLPEAGTPAENQALTRGQAILLKRFKPAGGEIAPSFTLYGQVATTATVSSTLAAGSASQPCFSLIAPPAATATQINAGTWENVSKNDMIIISGQAPFTYNADTGKWGHSSIDLATRQKTWADTEATIPAGQGAWYRNVGGRDVTVTWSNMPSVSTAL